MGISPPRLCFRKAVDGTGTGGTEPVEPDFEGTGGTGVTRELERAEPDPEEENRTWWGIRGRKAKSVET